MTDLTTEEVVDISTKHTYGTWRAQKSWKPMHVVDAEGCTFTNAAGKTFLDFSSQLMCSSLGHKNQAVIDAICEQAKTLPYIGPGFTTTARAELSKLLLEVLPEGMERFFFTTSGTEANEAAFRIARLFTGKHKIISRYNSYHGSTAGALAATGDVRRWQAEPSGVIDGVIFAPECNPYRSNLTGAQSADYIEYMIENEGNVAAVIIEPIVGTNGVLVPPPDYLPRLREITKKHGVLLIADEVMTGWGRTGSWFAVDHWDVKPDILVTAKGITGAYVPLGLCATSKEIADHFEENYFPLGHTYEAHPLTLAPAVAAINELKKHGLVERAVEMGKILGGKLEKLKENHPSVGDVRGKGLFWAVEIVRDREKKTKFNTWQDKLEGKPYTIEKVCAAMMKQGVFMMGWQNHLLIAPPLIVTEDQMDQAVAAIDEALKIADSEL
ncbi:MAG: aminotransferase class III-fold pyridoxal phosphate-dependent enzyme [Planctomycetota bacterium]|nr:aminotransferase class III-fold pyridoxal phosphate-dependent enzyme [Planctomycetota bacterium]